jgi:hypothetical protein
MDKPEVRLQRDVDAIKRKLGRLAGELSAAAHAAQAALMQKTAIGEPAAAITIPAPATITTARTNLEALL